MKTKALLLGTERRSPLLIQAEAVYLDAAAAPRRGRRRAEEVAEAARAADDDAALVVALRAAGYAARELYQHEDARRLLGEAVRIARRVRLRRRLCEVLITRSAMHIELGQPRQARRDLVEARAVAPAALQAEVDFAEGLLADKTGEFTAAAEAYRRALDGTGARDVLRVKTLNNLALTIARFGRYDEAERLLEEAIRLASPSWKAREGVCTESYAVVAVDSGRPVDALRRYQRAERLLTDVGVQLVDLYLGKARALLTLRLLDEAAEAADRAVREVEGRVGGSMMLAESLLPQAQIALARERPDEALHAASRAEGLFRAQRRTGWRAVAALLRATAQMRIAPDARLASRLDRVEQTMSTIGDLPGVVEAALLQGEVSATLGRARKARSAFDRAAQAARRGPLLVRLQGRTAEARKAELNGDTRRLGRTCSSGLDELATYRATLASAELRARAAAHGRTLAAIGLRSALRSGRPEQIWAWLERSNSVVFVREAPDVDRRLRPHLAELRVLESELEEVSPDDAITRSGLLRRITALERTIRNLSWTRGRREDAWVSPTVRMLRRLRGDLGHRALLQYCIVDGQLHGVAVTRRGIAVAEIGPIAEAVAYGRHLAFALRRLTQRSHSQASVELAMASARHDLRGLADALLAPLAHAFESAGEIVVAPPGDLVGIPWGSLAPIADRPVRVVPSAIAWWHSHGRSPATSDVVLVGGPGLEGVDKEIQEIARRHDGVTRLTDGHATAAAVQRAADGAALVHVAAHGRLRSDSPTFSSIQLSDGPLTVHDLEGLSAPAHHWVLATCDLGRPGALAGPALEGVLAALLAGGSGAVIAATVSVPDLDTKHLMVELHQCLAAGESMAESLRRARTAVDPSTPTGFVAGTAFTCYGGG